MLHPQPACAGPQVRLCPSMGAAFLTFLSPLLIESCVSDKTLSDIFFILQADAK